MTIGRLPGTFIRPHRQARALVPVRRLQLRIRLGGGVVAVLVLAAVLAPLLAPSDPLAVDTTQLLRSPSPEHPLGTDDLGRDLLSRVLWGGRASFLVAIGSVGLGMVVGVAIGLASGYLGRTTDLLLMRVIDAILSFPPLLLALAITAVLGPQLRNAVIAIGVLAIPTFARLTRSQVLSTRQQDFVTAAHAIGLPHLPVVWRHVLPHIITPLIVTTTLWAGYAILAEAALSFLGLGVQAPEPSWGSDVAYAQRQIAHGAWWTVAGPGGAIFLTVFALNVLGDGLRDHFDLARTPRSAMERE